MIRGLALFYGVNRKKIAPDDEVWGACESAIFGNELGLPGLFYGETEGRLLFGCLDSGWRYPCRAAALDA